MCKLQMETSLEEGSEPKLFSREFHPFGGWFCAELNIFQWCINASFASWPMKIPFFDRLEGT